MKIVLLFMEPDYGQLVSAALPLVRDKLTDDGSFKSQLARTVLELPEEALISLADELPGWKVSKLLSAGVKEYESRLISLANSLLFRYDLPLYVDGISLSPSLGCSISFSDIDFDALARRFLPLLSDTLLKDSPLAPLLKLPTKLCYAAIEKMSQERKEQLLSQLVSRFEGQIIRKLESLARERGFDISIIAVYMEE